MNDDQIRELLQSMRDSAPPADSLVRVRQRVAERTMRVAGRPRRWWWAALLPALLTFLIVFRPQPQVPPRPQLHAQPKAQAVPPPATAAIQLPPLPPAPAVRKQPRVRPAAPPSNPAPLIRVETADPDVVIFLVGGE